MNRIKFERERQGISAKELAKATKMPMFLYLIRERRFTFTVPQFRRLCAMLNIEY